jgi:hypothetical protein
MLRFKSQQPRRLITFVQAVILSGAERSRRIFVLKGSNTLLGDGHS